MKNILKITIITLLIINKSYTSTPPTVTPIYCLFMNTLPIAVNLNFADGSTAKVKANQTYKKDVTNWSSLCVTANQDLSSDSSFNSHNVFKNKKYLPSETNGACVGNFGHNIKAQIVSTTTKDTMSCPEDMPEFMALNQGLCKNTTITIPQTLKIILNY